MTADREPPGSLSTDELLRRYRAAEDPALLEEIVVRFEPLARSVARRYHARGEPLEDLTQVAMVGLLKAIARFDPERGFAFTSFATPTMLGELKRYFRDSGWAVHVPRGVKERALELASVTDQLSSKLGRSPSLWSWPRRSTQPRSRRWRRSRPITAAMPRLWMPDQTMTRPAFPPWPRSSVPRTCAWSRPSI